MTSFEKDQAMTTETENENREERMQVLRYKNFSIEIDCPPGQPRPGDLFPEVIAGTGLTEGDFVITSKVFGNWTWVLRDGDEIRDHKFIDSKPIFKERLSVLHDDGIVRYASW